MDLTNLTLREAAALIERRAISPLELTRAHLERIDRLEPALTSFITITAEAALRQAREAEAAMTRPGERGPLHGLPVALKDLFETEGVRTSAGSPILREYVPAQDCAVAQRLKAAGAISLGKLNMDEWAMSVATDNPFYGACKNPWDRDRSPGGSSGGAGAALAAGLCLGALGSDTAGSIRIPAALCGIVGLKPTYGLCPTQGALPLSWSLDHAGPMARSVADAALLLQVIADRPDAVSYADLRGELRGLRIGLAFEGFLPAGKAADPEVLAAVREAARVFEALGARVSELALPEAHTLWRHTSCILLSDALAVHERRSQEQPGDFSPAVRGDLERAARYTGADYARARQVQRAFRQRMRDVFASHDLLITPATPVAAPPRAGLDPAPASRPPLITYTAPFNLAGCPALALPCGFTASGLPIGLQIVGPAGGDRAVLDAGHGYEQATIWHQRRPNL